MELSEITKIRQFAASVTTGKFPEHIAIIMDGNRRWAKKNGLAPLYGHMKGAEALIKIAKGAAELGVKVLTVFGFSTENWNRSAKEVEALMNIIESQLICKKDEMVEGGIHFDVIGDEEGIPDGVKRAIEMLKEATENCKKMDLVLAINYGGRNEISRAIKKIFKDIKMGLIQEGDISEKMISNYLDTYKWKDPDLIIRTSGENRLSNFLLWQISYSELYVTDVLWPDFGLEDLCRAIVEYQRRERRLGGT